MNFHHLLQLNMVCITVLFGIIFVNNSKYLKRPVKELGPIYPQFYNMLSKQQPNTSSGSVVVLVSQNCEARAPSNECEPNGNHLRTFFPGAIWPNGKVAYKYHSSLTVQDRNEVQKAFLDIQSKTCIRFHSSSKSEKAFVKISVDRKLLVCGHAEMCRTGRSQIVMFGGSCRDKDTMVHELSHSLCLTHEFNRRDRDDYLQFDGCAPNKIPPKNDHDTRGHLFDYQSRMMYQCREGDCRVGWPKKGRQPAGECNLSDGLSVLDADKINDLYSCKGCFSHRWRPIDAFTSQDKINLVPFGRTEEGDPLYLCRGYGGGTVTAGKFWLEGNTGLCYISIGGGEVDFSTQAQVFILPKGRVITDDGARYEALPINSTNFETIIASAVPMGRKANAVKCFGATADIQQDGHGRETSIGVVCEDDMNTAYFPYWGREVTRNLGHYALITCRG